jgi:hypothetical protein
MHEPAVALPACWQSRLDTNAEHLAERTEFREVDIRVFRTVAEAEEWLSDRLISSAPASAVPSSK